MTMKRLAVCLSVVSCSVSIPAQAHGFYTKTGFLGTGLGYFHDVTDHVSLRADVTSMKKFQRNLSSGGIDYRASLDAEQFGAYGDWFPFDNGFRLSAGVHVRKLQAQAQGRPSNGMVVIHNTPVAFDPEDAITGQVKFPTTAPYLGIGWGYHGTQTRGFGFVVELGVSFGKPTASLVVSDSLRAKLNAAAALGATTAEAELEGQRQKLAATVGKVKVFPQAYVGASYRF